MRPVALALAAVTVAATLTALPRAAHACGALPCSNPPSSIANRKLPSGTTGIPLPAGASEEGKVQIVDVTGNPIATSLVQDESFAALRAEAPLADGKYTLVVPNRCAAQGGPVAVSPVLSHPFEVGGAAKAPTSLGTFTVSGVERTPAQTAQNDCQSSTPEVSGARLSFTPSGELTPHLSLARLWLTVDGKPWASERFGGTDGAWTGGAAPTLAFSKSIRSVMAACGETPKTFSGFGAVPASSFLAPGPHVVELHGKLAGAAAELAPLRVDVDLRCDAPYASEPWSEDDGTSNVSSCAASATASGRAPGSPAPGLPFGGALAILAVFAGSIRRAGRGTSGARTCPTRSSSR